MGVRPLSKLMIKGEPHMILHHLCSKQDGSHDKQIVCKYPTPAFSLLPGHPSLASLYGIYRFLFPATSSSAAVGVSRGVGLLRPECRLVSIIRLPDGDDHDRRGYSFVHGTR